MPHILIEHAEIEELLKDSTGLSPSLRQKLSGALVEPDERHEGIVELARAQHYKEGEIEIDDSALLSEGDDNGTYVMAWVWVDFVGTPYDKDAEPVEA